MQFLPAKISGCVASNAKSVGQVADGDRTACLCDVPYIHNRSDLE